MLTSASLQAALPLAELLDAQDLYIEPLEGSPLEQLVNATRSDPNFTQTDETGEVRVSLEDIEFIANKEDSDGVCDHHLVLDDVTEVVVRALEGHIDYAKRVVAADVAGLVDAVGASIADFNPSQLLGMEVVVSELPAPLRGSSLIDSIEQFSGGVVVVEEIPDLRLPALDAEQIRTLVVSGAASLDAEISEWLSGLDANFLPNLWEQFFRHGDFGSTRTLSDWLGRSDEAASNALAVFLITRRLVEDPIEGIELNLRSFERAAADLRDQAALRLSHVLQDDERARADGFMVKAVRGMTVVVNGRIYADWVAGGGRPEVLFGNLLQSRPARTTAQLSEQATELTDRWSAHTATMATTEGNRRFARIKELLEHHFVQRAMAIELPEGDAALALDDALPLFQAELAQVREDDTKNLYAVALRLLGRSRYVRTDAEKILSGIEVAKRMNPGADVREAAAVSVLQYVAEWVATQLVVKHL